MALEHPPHLNTQLSLGFLHKDYIGSFDMVQNQAYFGKENTYCTTLYAPNLGL